MPPHLPFGIGTKAANRNLRANVHYLISRHPKLHFTLNHYNPPRCDGGQIRFCTLAARRRYIRSRDRLSESPAYTLKY
jgi:hypothetical protein